jgi:hypothetical protein
LRFFAREKAIAVLNKRGTPSRSGRSSGVRELLWMRGTVGPCNVLFEVGFPLGQIAA